METQPSSQPTQSSKQPSHLPLAIISVIISGLVFGLAGYWYGNNISTSTTPTASPVANTTATSTPAADPTASWQSYRNETIGLSFKYPSSIRALSMLTERSTTGAGYTSDTNKDTKLQLGLRTTDWTYGRGAYFLDNAKPSFVINDPQFKPVKTLTVDSQKVYLADSASLPAWANPVLGPSDPLAKNSLAAFVTFTGNDGKTWGLVLKDADTSIIDRATFEQIIGTMKFGKSVVAVTADPTAGWKTYTDSTYGISFKYPTTWKLDTQKVPNASVYLVAELINFPTASGSNVSAGLDQTTRNNNKDVSFSIFATPNSKSISSILPPTFVSGQLPKYKTCSMGDECLVLTQEVANPTEMQGTLPFKSESLYVRNKSTVFTIGATTMSLPADATPWTDIGNVVSSIRFN